MSETADQPAVAKELPPLRIHHFMLWTVVSAALFTIIKSFSISITGGSWQQGTAIPFLLIYSVSITGLLLGVTWLSRGLPFFHQPGHASLVIHSLACLQTVGMTMLVQWDQGELISSSDFMMKVFIYGSYAYSAILVASITWFAYRFRQPRRWCVFFLVLAGTMILQFLASYLIPYLLRFGQDLGSSGWMAIQISMYLVLQTLPTVALLWVVVRDRQLKLQYHWTHWLGVALWFSTWFASLVYLTMTYLWPPESFQ